MPLRDGSVSLDLVGSQVAPRAPTMRGPGPMHTPVRLDKDAGIARWSSPPRC